MKVILKYSFGLIFLMFVVCLNAQNSDSDLLQGAKFEIRGSVKEQKTLEPIENVNIEVSSGAYTTTNFLGEFKILARKGDQIIIRHKDFETVYHTIQSDDRIQVEVEPLDENEELDIEKESVFEKRKSSSYEVLIDSAKINLKADAKKSIQFVTDALSVSRSAKENAEAYAILGDINMFWKQFDLATSNYRISLQSNNDNEVKLKLAKAYKENKNYQESLEVYQNIEKSNLSNWQLTELFEGMGDVNYLTKDYPKALSNYQEGLKVAKEHLITPKITDLNSKIAQTLTESGDLLKAKQFFNKSLKLASSENKKRAIEEKIKVADFNNGISNFSDEIELRKEALKDLNEVPLNEIYTNESALTPQKQNYKIGNAYAATRDYESAIPYLEKSIAEADDNEDLIVKKDATRRLSEVYRDAGEFDKALTAYQEYVDLVDKLYIKKEQQIAQAARFSRDLISKQNRILNLEGDRALSESKYQLNLEQSKRQKLIIYSLIGGLILLLIVAFLMYKYIKQQRLANNLLALKSLRSQMNPHFIFNALNSVNSFIALNDERTANKYLTDFSLLMRAVLENSEEDFIPLEKEIELLRRYVKLEHFRFQDKFDYNISIDENIKLEDYSIPPMLLQPYIENAVWHGLRYKKSKGHLNIDFKQVEPDEISIQIYDDGIGRAKSKLLKTKNQKKQNSKGLGNIEKRVAILNNMYKDRVGVSIADYQEGEQDTGTKVTVTLKKE